MEGLVLPVTAFMSFASILWLVVAKLANSGNEEEAGTTSTASANNEDHLAVTVSSSGNIQISAKTITSKIILLFFFLYHFTLKLLLKDTNMILRNLF